jgi:hypothetical protein
MLFFMRRFGFLLVLTPCLYGETLPTPQALLDRYESDLETLEMQLDQGVATVKNQWVQKLTRLRDESRLQANLSDWLWAERMLRVTEEMKQHWIGIFTEPADGNEHITTLKQEIDIRIKTLKNTADEQVVLHEKNVRDKLTLLEKELVRGNRLDEAIACRQAVSQVEKSKRRKHLLQKIKQFDSTSHWKQDRKRRAKIVKSHEEAGAPPNARFLFTETNPAFTSFAKATVVLSAGKSAGPAAGIRLGSLVDKRGTRGLTVIALYNQEILIDETFDTYAELSESERLTQSIKELPYGSFVVMAVRDDATRRFSGGAQSTLKRLGAEKGIQHLPYRSAYLLIGVKGLVPGHAVERWDAHQVRYPAAL